MGSTYMYTHRDPNRSTVRVCEHSHEHKQHQRCCAASISGGSGWRSGSGEEIMQTCTHSPTRKKTATKKRLVSPAAGCKHALPSSGCWLLVFAVADTWIFKLLISLTLTSPVTDIIGSSCTDCWQSDPPLHTHGLRMRENNSGK